MRLQLSYGVLAASVILSCGRSSTPSSVALDGPHQAALVSRGKGQALLIVGDSPQGMGATERALRDQLSVLGINVEARAAKETQAVDAYRVDLVVIADSVLAGDLESRTRSAGSTRSCRVS